jgi:RNA polymerase sigma factor (TIGR02999 family)
MMTAGDVTRILTAAEHGDPQALHELLPLVYAELRQLAAQKLAGEAPGHTLQATALVHEAYLRLVGPAGDRGQHWQGRRHFFGAAAEAMRRILVDSARRRRSDKRGGDAKRQDLDSIDVAAPEPADAHPDLLAVNEALDKLAAADPAAAELVKLRYFAGLSLPEAATVLDVSVRTADRLWAYGRAWLHREIAGP